MVIIKIFCENPNLWNALKKFATAISVFFHSVSVKSTAPQKLNTSCFKPKHVWKIRIIFRSPEPTNVAFHSQFCISPSFESPGIPTGSTTRSQQRQAADQWPCWDFGSQLWWRHRASESQSPVAKKELGSIWRWLLHWWIYHGILPLRNQGLARTCQVPTYENNRSTRNKSFGDETHSSHNVIPQNVMLVGFQNPQRYYS